MIIIFDLPLEIPKNEVTNAKDDPYPLFLIQIQFKYGNPLSIVVCTRPGHQSIGTVQKIVAKSNHKKR